MRNQNASRMVTPKINNSSTANNSASTGGVDIPDELAEQIKELAQSEFIANKGMSDGEALTALTKDFLNNFSGSQLNAAVRTVDQIFIQEARHMTSEVRTSQPNWNYGQSFDESIVVNKK